MPRSVYKFKLGFYKADNIHGRKRLANGETENTNLRRLNQRGWLVFTEPINDFVSSPFLAMNMHHIMGKFKGRYILDHFFG